MNMFDQFRSAAAYALSFSRDWLSHPQPGQLAWQLARQVFLKTLGERIEALPEDMRNAIWMNALISGRWAATGYPTVTLGHKTAAAFCGTRMRCADAAEFLKPPWPAFCIRLPPGLLSIDAHDHVHEAELLLACALAPHEMSREVKPQSATQHRWWYRLVAPCPHDIVPAWMKSVEGFFSGTSLWGFNLATELLGIDVDPDQLDHWGTDNTDRDTRSGELAKSLLVSTCMYLSGDPRERAKRLEENGVTLRERKSKYREGDLLPQYTSFELASSIKPNLHHAVRDYVDHGGSSPTVQTCVAGHWKRVAYGVGRAHRKMMHIQPYWRGDINAPISARVK